MSKRKWAVGKFCAVLPITNRLRFGNGVLTQCGVQALAHKLVLLINAAEAGVESLLGVRASRS
jgi:hypothetical protein